MQVYQPTSKILLNISCNNLISLDTIGQSDPMAVLFKMDPRTHAIIEVGRTETYKNDRNPKFSKSFNLDYHFEQTQLYQIQVYDIDSKSTDLKKHDFIGQMNFNLGELAGAPGMFLTKKLDNPKKPARQNGTCTVSGEEIQENNSIIHFRIAGKNLDKKDFFGKSDPFLVFYRQQIDGSSWIKSYQTEVIKSNLNPVWKSFSVSANDLCGGQYDRPIRIECLDWNRSGKPDLIGITQLSLPELDNSRTKIFDIIEPKKQKKKRSYKNSGTLSFLDYRVERITSFLDYLYGGCQISLVVAVDFTASNGNPVHTSSLHYHDAYTVNDYQKAISTCGTILANYDTAGQFPVFGFGAKVGGQVSHCFPLNGNPQNPYVPGVQGILQAYHNAFYWPGFTLWGPTNFAPIINSVAQIARGYTQMQNNQKYFVLLFLTDGEITDFELTKKAIVDAADLPISIVIVGVGSGEFKQMEILDGDEQRVSYQGRKAVRDIVQFVPFRAFLNRDISALAQETLAEIPAQLVSYYKSKNIQPNPGYTAQQKQQAIQQQVMQHQQTQQQTQQKK
ncbi:copine [Anaeramoeba ignava]|uniref:Copine-3 n=1 Tax=Anaeramoeba ignava TaxID=1746090 RepID=A0A9Q0RE46_ANAIG|nr:copine [Anaeramoeba ignava]